MNQNKIKNISFNICALFFLIFPLWSVVAQERQLQQPKPQNNLIADTSIYNTQIVSQDNNNFEIAFVLLNKGGIQDDIKYVINLKTKQEEKNYYVDSHVSGESIKLEQNEALSQRVNYTAPAFLNGDFQMSIQALNSKGLNLASSQLGEVTLNGDNQYIEVDPNNCELFIEGDDQQYPLNGSVEIESQNQLNLRCNLVNNSDRTINYKPNFIVKKRSKAGEIVNLDQRENETKTLGAGSSREVLFSVPIEPKAQVYFVEFSLQEQGEMISNKVLFRYSVEGLSASIQDLKIFDTHYKKGEEVRAKIVWNSYNNALGYSLGQGNGLRLAFSVTNGRNQFCVDPVFQKLNDKQLTLKYESQVECFSPKVKVAIFNSDQEILDSRVLEVDSQSIGNIAQESKQTSAKFDEGFWKTTIVKVVLGLLVFILALITILVLFKKINKKK